MSRLKILGSWMERLTTEVYDRLINLWKKGMEPEDIAEELNISVAQVRRALDFYCGNGRDRDMPGKSV